MEIKEERGGGSRRRLEDRNQFSATFLREGKLRAPRNSAFIKNSPGSADNVSKFKQNTHLEQRKK